MLKNNITVSGRCFPKPSAYRRHLWQRRRAALILLFGLLAGCMPARSYDYHTIVPAPEILSGATVRTPASGRSTSGRSTSGRGTPGTGAPIAARLDARPVAGGAADHPTPALTLAEAVNLALANNPDMLQAAAHLEQARAARQIAGAAFFPLIGLYTEYSQGDAPSAFLFNTIDQRHLPPQTDFNRPGWFQNFETGLKGRINLFQGFQDILAVGIADQHIAMAAYQQQQLRQFLQATVIDLYYQVLAAADFIQIAEESAATVAEQLRVMQVRFEAGGALKSDILSLEVRHARALEEIVRSNSRLKNAEAHLAELLGLAPATPLQLELPPVQMTDGFPDETAGLALALRNRPEIQHARLQVVTARIALDQARGGYLPRLDLNAKYYHDDEHMAYSHDRANWLLALTLDWNIFNGMATRAEVARAHAALTKARAADRKTQLAVARDVHRAYLRWQDACARLEVAETSVMAARESLALVVRQYEGGAATISRYLEAELAYNQARMAATAAYYDRESMLADVVRATAQGNTGGE